MPSLEQVPDPGESRRMAALLGVHLVSQVLDQACTAADAAQRIGWFKDITGKLTLTGCKDIFGKTLQGDNENLHENKENSSHLTTSTPHKDDIIKTKPENSFIGQGDEEIDMVSKDNVVDQNEEEIQPQTEETVVVTEAQMFSSYIMLAIMDKLYETAFGVGDKNEDIESGCKERPNSPIDFLEQFKTFSTPLDENSGSKIFVNEGGEELKSAEEYCFSYLENEMIEYEAETGNDVAFFVDEDGMSIDDFDQIKVVVKAEIHAEIEETEDENYEGVIIEEVSEEAEAEEVEYEEDTEADKADRLESVRYENAYLSLNRDYEQCSDDDGDPILQDPKTPMQDVELCTISTEDDDDTSSYRETEEEKERKELAATSAVSGASKKSRTSLVSRCRSQGARLLACLRGWWRRKAPGKRKESRAPSSVRGICPLSPDARRRAASLLDQRHLYSPLASRSVVWKFNTVNEAVVNSSKWKEYTFEVNPDGHGEHC